MVSVPTPGLLPAADYFDSTSSAAQVVCRMLGYAGGTARGSAYYGQPERHISLSSCGCSQMHHWLIEGWNNGLKI